MCFTMIYSRFDFYGIFVDLNLRTKVCQQVPFDISFFFSYDDLSEFQSSAKTVVFEDRKKHSSD